MWSLRQGATVWARKSLGARFARPASFRHAVDCCVVRPHSISATLRTSTSAEHHSGVAAGQRGTGVWIATHLYSSAAAAAGSSVVALTESAIARLQEVARPDEVLRVTVESGGCSGFQYKLELVERGDLDNTHK
jgi:Iron-sulphur cluster biosynthesis